MSILRSVILAAASIVAVSCARPVDIPGGGPPAAGEVRLRFGLSVPHSGMRATRAADDAEFAVNNISLLVFVRDGGSGDYTYRYTAVGRRLDRTAGNTDVAFEALLVGSDDQVRLLAVANHADGLTDALAVGTTEAEVRGTLVGSGSDLPRGIPMTGVAELNSISDETGIVRIPLIRSVAKATVTVDPDGTSSGFTISGVTVWRTPAGWQYFPGAGSVENEATAPLPLVPSVAAGGGVVNRDFEASDDPLFHSAYVYETAIPSGVGNPAATATCIVVGGRFPGDVADTYYRINFGSLGDQANPLGQVLRNYWYEFTIVGVDGPGWESAQLAAENPASGLRTSVVPWSGGGNTDYYFGDHEYIKLSAAEMLLGAQTGQTATMTITTSDVPFSLASVHYPGAGLLDISGPGRELETDKMRFEISSLPTARPDERQWQLTVTALTNDQDVDYLQLHAADGLMTIIIFIRRDGSGQPPGPNDSAKRRIRVLTLGTNTFGSLNRQTNRGVPAMLRNTSYFGPQGTVPCAGIEILPTVTTTTDAQIVREALAGADIIVTTWAYTPSSDVSTAIWQWITEPKTGGNGRVAFLTSDSDAVIHDLRGLLDGVMVWSSVGAIRSDPPGDHGYGSGFTRFAPMNAAEDDPFLDGVFGDARYLRADRVSYDSTSQYMNISNTYLPITPLIVATGDLGPNNNLVLMGVDTERHIVYLGESRLLHTEAMGTTTESSWAYDPDNYINAIWSNTWAWAVNTVIAENYDADGALVE